MRQHHGNANSHTYCLVYLWPQFKDDIQYFFFHRSVNHTPRVAQLAAAKPAGGADARVIDRPDAAARIRGAPSPPLRDRAGGVV